MAEQKTEKKSAEAAEGETPPSSKKARVQTLVYCTNPKCYALAPCAQHPTGQELTLTKIPIMKAGLLIRKPPAMVFEAIVNPELTTKFWFTKSSGRLVVGEPVTWEWEMYGLKVPVTVRQVEPHSKVVIEWQGSTVEWELTEYPGDLTFLSITESGYQGSGDEVVKKAMDSTQGFNLVLAALKAFLEHGIQLNIVADHVPPKAA